MEKRSFSIVVLAIVILLLIFYIVSTQSLSNSPNNKKAGHSLVSKAFPQYNIIKSFDTGMNLQGFILVDKQDPNKKTVTFTTKDGNTIVNGELLTWNLSENKLTNLNNIYVGYYQSDTKANDLYVAIKQNATYIQQGSNDAPKKIYAIIDPSCSYCHYLFKAVQPAIKSGQLVVRWIPIAKLGDSKHIVNSIFNSKDPLQSLIDYETNNAYDKDAKDNVKTTNNIIL